MRRIFISILPLIVSACSGAPATSEQPKTIAPSIYKPTEEELTATHSELIRLAEASKKYFKSQQRYSAQEPWHPLPEPDENGEPYEDDPVIYEELTFPGGAGFTMSTHPTIPQGGELLMPSLSSANGDVQAVINSFKRYSVVWPNTPTRFKYTYTVGPKRGASSTVTITAEANFDTSNDTIYTLGMRVEVDKQTGAVNIFRNKTIE